MRVSIMSAEGTEYQTVIRSSSINLLSDWAM